MTRVREEVEREWRQKEKEAGLKRLMDQKVLQKERLEQINNKRIMQAIEIERDRLEFEKILYEQRAVSCEEKKELERRRQQALILRNEILKQVSILLILICNYTRKFERVYTLKLVSLADERKRARTHRPATKDVRGRSGDSCGS